MCVRCAPEMPQPVRPLLVVAVAVALAALPPARGSPPFAAQRRLAQADEADSAGAARGGGFLEECKWLDALPRDLSSQGDADLDRYGGRQDSTDGGLDLHGLQFRVPSPAAGGRRVLTTSVRVLVPSVLKIKCSSADPGVACAVAVAPEGGGSGEDRLLHVGATDTGTVLLPSVKPARGGKGQRHEIHLTFTVPDGTETSACLGFEFMLQMRPSTSVRDELRCPPALPAAVLPPRRMTVGEGGDGLHFASDELLITPEELLQHGSSDGAFIYPMSIRVRGGAATITAQASFDWILGDLHLELARVEDDDLAGSRGHVLVRSNQTETADEDAQFERSAKLAATVPAGRYRLTLRDKTTTQLQAGVGSGSAERQHGDEGGQPGSGMCVRFALSLDAELAGPGASLPRLSERKEPSPPAVAGKAAGGQQAAGDGGASAIRHGASQGKPLLLSVEPATAHNLNPEQPLKLLLSFSGPLARFGKDEDGTQDAGRGGRTGAKEVQCSGTGAAPSWRGSALCSTVFSLRPSGVDQQRGPLVARPNSGEGASRGALTPASIRLAAVPAAGSMDAAQLELIWSAGALVDGVEYVLRIEEDYLNAGDGSKVSVGAHNGGMHVYRAAACNCHGHGRCDVEHRCACAVGYAGEDCQRCSEGHRLSDEGICEPVKATVQCSRTSCNGHGSVSARKDRTRFLPHKRASSRAHACPPLSTLVCVQRRLLSLCTRLMPKSAGLSLAVDSVARLA